MSQTFLANLPALEHMLGPVFSPLNRTTPRIVSALGAGFTALSMEEMKGCGALFVCAQPDETVSLLEAARHGGVLEGVHTLVLVESSALAELPDGLLAPVRDSGCLSAFPVRRNPAFLVEGSLRFRRFCQELLDVPISRLVVARRESRAMVNAGVFLAEEFCLPLLEATQAAFAAAGIARDQAREIGAELLREAVENASFAGRKRWTGILHTRDRHRLGEIVRALDDENRSLANLAISFSHRSLAAMGKDTHWLASLHPERENNDGESASSDGSEDQPQPVEAANGTR
ncbi:MAG: hypothetical protein LC114_18855 [Bryobacterales bacterium]|nr:hypothetical protein [Bryobacterales bacterium]